MRAVTGVGAHIVHTSRRCHVILDLHVITLVVVSVRALVYVLTGVAIQSKFKACH